MTIRPEKKRNGPKIRISFLHLKINFDGLKIQNCKTGRGEGNALQFKNRNFGQTDAM